jgi:hypothetical protein
VPSQKEGGERSVVRTSFRALDLKSKRESWGIVPFCDFDSAC